jgi:YVTN family beta-propeller protein
MTRHAAHSGHSRLQIALYLVIWSIVGAIAIGAQPVRADSLVYIPLGSENAAIVVDTARDAVVGRIGGLPAAHGLAMTPDSKFLVAGSYAVRGPDVAAPAKPAGVSEEEHAAHHPPPANKAPGAQAPAKEAKKGGVSTVSVVRVADKQIVRRIDVPGAVHHVAISPDGRFAVVTHPDEDSISAVDLGTYQVAATVKTGSVPNYAAFGRDGSALYVSNAGAATVSVVDVGRWTVKGHIAVGDAPEHVVMSPDGDTLYVNNVNDGTVSVVSLGRGKAVKAIPVGSTPHGLDVSEDGKTLFVTAMGDDKVVAVTLATGERRNVTLAPAPYHLAVIRGAGKLYVSSADKPKAWVVDQRDLRLLGEIAIGGKGHQLTQRPQG